MSKKSTASRENMSETNFDKPLLEKFERENTKARRNERK